MKKNQLETLIYSTVGVVAMFIIIVAVNFIASRAKARVDMTAEKAYTLSDGTKAILNKLDTPIEFHFYFSRSENQMPIYLKNYAQQVEDLLEEYAQVSKGKITIKKYDPQPDSDAEDSAHLDGIEGQMMPTGERIYLGLAVVLLNEKSSLPFLMPDRERLLEYDISRAITRVVNPEKPVVGVMTPLQVFGQPQMMRRMGQQPRDPWTFISELKKDFTVREIMMTVDKIDEDVKVLLVVHPKEIGDAAQYAIDQFVMRGGKLIAFLDPNCYFDEQKKQNQFSQFGGGGESSSSLEKLLKGWGLEFESGKVVADMNFSSKTRSGNGQVIDAPAVLSVTKEGASKDDVVTSQIDTLLMPFAGAFSGTPKEGVKKVTLLKTTTKSQLVDTFMAMLPGDTISKEFKASDKEMDLAIRLTGKFKTAFPEGKPKPAADPEDKDKAEKKDEPDNTIKESTVETSIVLIGDADLLNDAVSVQVVEPFPGLRIPQLMGSNLPFVQGLVEQMAGDSNLIAVRSRATLNRPFTLVKDLEAKANERFKEQLKQLEQSAQEAQQKINEMQRAKSKEQRFIMSPEQQKELEKLRETEAKTSKELKAVRKQHRQEIDSLETSLKWWNILGMPAVVAISGIVLAVFKRKRTAAK